jgi:2C-methyl-D-erythritol 2,4-cyclodiphosphate synthase
VVFGGTNVGADGNFDISSLDGSNGFVINGIEANDNLGWSVSSAGDINGDGIADLIIGAPGNKTTYARNDSSKSYVVFGGTNIGEGGSFDLSLLDGSNGFVINGINPSDYSGLSVSGAGDINGDGIADLIIGAPGTDYNGSYSGSTYIVFGGAGVGAGGSFDLSSLDGNNGFVLNGIAAGDGQASPLAVLGMSTAMALMT